jgi:peptidoglycan/xylan/chitin deacetylase (PgdA/CDA1 family)
LTAPAGQDAGAARDTETYRSPPSEILVSAGTRVSVLQASGMGIPMLMYHAVADDIDSSEAEWSVTSEAFEAQMRLLRDEGWSTFSMSSLCALWDKGEPPPPRSVVVTFDDGHACLHDVALPIMARYGITSTVYAIPGFLGRMSTYDTDHGTAPRAIMTAEQLRAMHAAGHEIGSHSFSHPDLRAVSAEGLHVELTRSRADLEDLVGAPVQSFAYPHGWFNRTVHDAVERAGYRSAASVTCGINTSETPRLLLRRANLGTHTTLSDFRQTLRYGGSPLGVMRVVAREQVIRMLATLRGRDPLDFYMKPISTIVR